MTPEERAAAVYSGLRGLDQNCPDDVADIAAAIRAAVLEEREECAKWLETESAMWVVNDNEPDGPVIWKEMTPDEVAAAIRARQSRQ